MAGKQALSLKGLAIQKSILHIHFHAVGRNLTVIKSDSLFHSLEFVNS